MSGDDMTDGTGWHADGELLARYAAGVVNGPEAMSLDAHLVACRHCQDALAAVPDVATSARLATIWSGIEAGVALPPAAATVPGDARDGYASRMHPRGWLAASTAWLQGLADPRGRLSVAVAALASVLIVASVGVAVTRPRALGVVAAPTLMPSEAYTPVPRTYLPPVPEVTDVPTVAPTPPPPPPPPVDVISADVKLVPFDSCPSLLDHLRAKADERVSAWGGFGTRGDIVYEPTVAGSPGGSSTTGGSTTGGSTAGGSSTGTDGGTTTGGSGEAPPTPSGAPPEPVPAEPAAGPVPEAQDGQEFSKTNVQEAGVDEPDWLKTDGTHAYIVRDNQLLVVDVTAAPPVVVGRLDLGARHYGQLLRSGDRLLVSAWAVASRTTPQGEAVAEPDVADRDVVDLVLIDIADPTRPTVVDEAKIEGRFVSAREVGGVARLVVTSAAPTDLPFVYPDEQRSEEQALAENRRIVAEAELHHWLPQVEHAGEWRQLAPCDAVDRPTMFSGFGSLSVVTVDLSGSLADLPATSVLTSAETVYASSSRLYVALPTFWDAADAEKAGLPAGTSTTSFHAFDIDGSDPAAYLGSGWVPGDLLNQFSMSEHAGYLRVATTEWDPTVSTTTSGVRVLQLQERELREVGHVGGLGQDERIYAVRFLGDVGYVVTFRQMDPLYTLDLSDPTAPRVVGELKITGYSAYLHPTTPGRLLGIGQEATEEGRRVGLQVSLFDTSDLANPQRLDQEVIGNADSSAEYDHHAFLYWSGSGLVMVPVTEWDPETSEQFVGAVAYTLAGDALEPLGEISQPTSPNGWRSTIERSFVVGDEVFTVSEAGMLASDLHTLEQRGWLAFNS